MTLDDFRKATAELSGNTPIVTSVGDHTWTLHRCASVCQLVNERWGQFGEYDESTPHGPLVTVVMIA